MRCRVIPEHELEGPKLPMSRELIALITTYPEDVVRVLTPLMSDERIVRIEQVLAARLRSVVVVLDHLQDPHNRAAILRTCEATGILEVHAITADGQWPLSRRVTQGCHKWLDIFVHRDTNRCARQLIERGYHLVEASEKSDTPSLEEEAGDDEREPLIALCLGNEHDGLTAELRQHCSHQLGIPMVGFTRSLNVSVAAALMLRRLTAGRRRGLARADEILLRARYYALSVRSPLDVLRREVSR